MKIKNTGNRFSRNGKQKMKKNVVLENVKYITDVDEAGRWRGGGRVAMTPSQLYDPKSTTNSILNG